MSQADLTVGYLRSMLVAMPSDMVVTIGRSSYSRRPLIFGHTKVYGEKHLLTVLEELFDDLENFHEPEPEHGLWRTVGDLLLELRGCSDWRARFNCTDDGSVCNFCEWGRRWPWT